MQQPRINFFSKIFFLLLFFLTFNLARASVSVGSIDPLNKVVKVCHDTTCTTFGRINFAPTINGSTPGATAIVITDTGITGTAWGDEIGWVNTSPLGAGITVNPNTGLLSGTAFSQVSGWINFSATGQSVQLVDNGSGSNFFGYAWASGANGGWIKFDCSDSASCVKTDWRAIPFRPTVPSGGGGPGGGGSVVPTGACKDTKAVNYTTDSTKFSNPGLCIYEIKKVPEPISDKPDLIGGEEPNVPLEFSPYVCKRY